MNQLQENGVTDPGSAFTFADSSLADKLLEEVINRIRGLAEVEFSTGQQATDAAREWLLKHPGPILCFIRNTGVLVGDSRSYLEHFACFTSLLNTQVLFATSTLDSGFRCLHCEGHYYAVFW